jgi:hypoxia up-regulated 1
MRLPLLVHILAFLSALPPLTFASFLAIDYGTDWIKASLMKPGVTFDVLLNKDSKRKIHASVGWKGTDRLFGTDAFNLVRVPLHLDLRRPTLIVATSQGLTVP